MIAYPPGHEPDVWSPDSRAGTHRSALGNTSRASVGGSPLIATSMDPSYADHSEADTTVNRLTQASVGNARPDG